MSTSRMPIPGTEGEINNKMKIKYKNQIIIKGKNINSYQSYSKYHMQPKIIVKWI